jgi:predicted alpha-1,2-mannosidase
VRLKSSFAIPMVAIMALHAGTIAIGATEGSSTRPPVDYVNPLLGTVHCRWFFFTPAAVPFGLVKLAPQTYGYGGYPGGGQVTGYDYNHDSIIGFSHLHEFQIGGILLMPTVGPLRTTPGSLEKPDDGFRSRYRKLTQVAEAGYYSVLLDKYGVRAELTATTRVGFHRYTFPRSDQAHILIDVGHCQGEGRSYRGKRNGLYVMGLVDMKECGPAKDSLVRKVSDTEIEGSVTFEQRFTFLSPFLFPPQPVSAHFVAVFSKPFRACGVFRDEQASPAQATIAGPGAGMYVDYTTAQNEAIEVKVGLSYVSIEQARLNLRAEAADLSFDAARAKARKAWNAELGRIEVEGGGEDDKIKFYTGLWHAQLGRGISNDEDGKYITFHDTVGQIPTENGVPQYVHYNSDGTWGGFTNLFQLWTLAYPGQASSFIKCHLDIYEASGWLPDGIACDKFCPGMLSNHLSPLVAAAFAKGIRDFDVAKAYDAVYKNETQYRDRPLKVGGADLEHFVKWGYVPVEKATRHAAVSHTLEFAYSSWCAAQMAEALGRTDDYAVLMKQAGAYQRLFDPATGFFRPRHEDSSFVEPFTPTASEGFEEGTAWHYLWDVPHDVQWLIDQLGVDRFNERLNRVFEESLPTRFVGPLYNQGNETDLHAVYLFNYSGRPWLSQKWVRQIMDVFYGVTPEMGYGSGQDEDQGEMGAWFVLAAMGLFDVQGGAGLHPTYQIGSPVFDRVILHLDPSYYPGGQFVIEARNNSPQHPYIQAATLNGRQLVKPWFDHAELVKGGSLVLEMGPEPNFRVWQ